MDFANAIRNESKWTYTENGAVALNTTGDKVLDLFSTIGSLRTADENRVTTLVSEAYKEDIDSKFLPAGQCVRNRYYGSHRYLCR